MGRKAKRIRLARAIARRDERAAAESAAVNATLKAENSVKIEELKAVTPEVVLEESDKVIEPMFTEQPKRTDVRKPEIKKAPVNKTISKKNTRAKTSSRKTKAKK